VNLSVVAGNLTIRSTTGQAFQFSMSQSVQAETQTFIGGVANSETTYTSGTVNLSVVGGNMTIRSTTGNAFQFSASEQNLSVGVSTGGNTAGNTTVNTGSRFVLVGSNMVSASQGTAAGATTITLNATQSVQTQDILSIGVSTGGNTSGDTTVNTGSRIVFAGGNNITLSQGTAAGATTITISGGAGGAGMSAGLSTGGNTSGDTGAVTGRLILAGGNNITLSGSTNAGSMTITVSAPNLGAGAMSAGVSNLGNTAGSTGATGTRLALVGTNEVTLSQSTDANGGTVTIVNPPPLILWNPWVYNLSVTAAHAQNTLHFQPYPFPHAVQHDRMVVPLQYSQATNSTLTVSVSFSAGMYTKNASTLSLLQSTSGSFSINGSGTASSNQNSGPKNATIGWTTTRSIGNYWLGFNVSTATAGANASLSFYRKSVQSSAWSGLIGVASNATNQVVLGMGDYTAATGAMPDSVAFSQINGSATLALREFPIWFVSESA
jgi:hypothetical protein